MVLRYLKQTGFADPSILMKAEAFVRAGYQRLLTFEVPGGGFSWFGETSANVMLSAYGLMEFAEMARVINIDGDILPRTRRWILSARSADGHWEESYHAHSLHTGDDDFTLTAFVAWCLLQAQCDPADLAPSLTYLREHLSGQTDPYALSLALNVFATAKGEDATASALTQRLLSCGAGGRWTPQASTLVDSAGVAGSVEASALAVLGFLERKSEPAAVHEAVRYLVSAKDPNGLWGTTTATVLALKALLADQLKSPTADPFTGTVAVTVDGKKAGEIPLSSKTYDVVQQLDLKEFARPGVHSVTLETRLSRAQVFSVQVVSSYYLPWEQQAPPALDVHQTFDRTRLAVDDQLTARVDLSSKTSSGSMVLLDLGIPPGFDVSRDDLELLVSNGTISRFELTPRQIILYLPPLQPGNPVRISYRLKARFPIRAVTPPGTAYEYYNPATRAELPPVPLEVN
jgi:hypothetical protein